MSEIIGIDPGVTGAIARVGGSFESEFWKSNHVEIYDLPSFRVESKGAKKRGHNVLDVNGTVVLLRELHDRMPGAIVLLEDAPIGAGMRFKAGDPPAPDGQGGENELAVSLNTLSRQQRLLGQIEGIVAAIGFRYEVIHPKTWKNAMMPGQAREKDAARQKAIQLFPHAAELLKLKKHHNRAEALLLCEWGRRRGL